MTAGGGRPMERQMVRKFLVSPMVPQYHGVLGMTAGGGRPMERQRILKFLASPMVPGHQGIPGMTGWTLAVTTEQSVGSQGMRPVSQGCIS